MSIDGQLYIGGSVFDGYKKPQAGLGIAVERGIIQRIAPVAEFDGFAGQIVDTSGGTLMPGLIDCHAHLFQSGEADTFAFMHQVQTAKLALVTVINAITDLAGGITAMRDCGGIEFTEFAVRDAIRDKKLLGPTIYAAGQLICMTGGHGYAMARQADGAAQIKVAVREQIRANCDLIKLMATGGVTTPHVHPADAHYTEDELRAGVDEAHRFRRKTAAHAQAAAGILNAVKAGIDSVEHGFYLTDESVALMIKSGTYLVPTLTPSELVLVNADRGIPTHVVDRCAEAREAHWKSVKSFYEAGGLIAMGSDVGTAFNFHGENAQELRHMVAAGMKPLDVLRSATSAAADLIGLANEGRIEEGFSADFLIVDGDPVADIEKAADYSNHRLVVKQGMHVTPLAKCGKQASLNIIRSE